MNDQATGKLAIALSVLACAGPWAIAGDAAAGGGEVDVVVVDETWTVPQELTLRARVTAIEPPEPTSIRWRHGGEGLGGRVTRGTLAERVAVGEWSPEASLRSLLEGRLPGTLFLTFMVGSGGKLKERTRGGGFECEGGSTGVVMEFEFRYRGEVLKRFREAGPDGGTIGIVVPVRRLAGGREPTDEEFVRRLGGLQQYAQRRAGALESLPWAARPVPQQVAIVTDVGGYGTGIYYGIRTANRAVVEAECRSLRQLGVNGFRNAPRFLAEMAYERQGFGAPFHRIRILHAAGYPVPRYRKGREEDPEAGCPYAPGVGERTRAGVAHAMELLDLNVDAVYGLTVDEIGSVFDLAPEGKAHIALCPRCAEGFRDYLRGLGLEPKAFGKATWEEVRPAPIWKPPPGEPRQDQPPAKPAWQTHRHDALLAYYTLKFNNIASASLFAPLRRACSQANRRKQAALAAGADPRPAVAQPWLYAYALRGNTFLMRGHSLDFFEFYRHADNAFVYETSNREARIWSWDSYLCDVGRVVAADRGLAFGVYVKPHRGAPIQRALAALARGATMLYWYTYGPDWAKGDSFSQHRDVLARVSKAARLIASAEPVLYRCSWPRPARVAIVKPRSSELWMRLAENPIPWQAAWENAKWTYTALQHAHLPVDPLDERMLCSRDLARYEVIYVSGPNVTRAAAAELAQWVEAGGTLYTSGWGLARDEANQPLGVLLPVLGLKRRDPPEMWYRVALYGATRIENYDQRGRVLAPVPPGARVVPSADLGRPFVPVIGREVLQPVPETDVLARFADGGAAITRHRWGKGEAWVVGFFPGLEYSAGVRGHTRAPVYDMSTDFDAGLRGYAAGPALERVEPVVDAAEPTVEGILVRNADSGQRAAVLINWAYRVTAHRKRGKRLSPVVENVPFEHLEVAIRGAGDVRAARSAWLDRPLPIQRSDRATRITLPRLEQGDVLLLE